jgi:hypothetical protein
MVPSKQQFVYATFLSILSRNYTTHGGFIEQKLMLSCSFRCDQIHKCNVKNMVTLFDAA